MYKMDFSTIDFILFYYIFFYLRNFSYNSFQFNYCFELNYCRIEKNVLHIFIILNVFQNNFISMSASFI